MLLGSSTQVIGTSHMSRGQVCQDRAMCWTAENGNTGIITLCDGAGSSAKSEFGAENLCDWFPHWANSLPEFWNMGDDELRTMVVAAIQAKLADVANKLGVEFRELASTFLAAVVRISGDEIHFRIIHLGDGVAACVSADGSVIISEPDNGEFANETVFTTSGAAIEQLRITTGVAPRGSGFVLMSDGSSASLFFKPKRALAPAIAEMLGWLNENDSDVVSDALEANTTDLLRLKTDDDCSLALLLDRFSASPFAVDLEHPQNLIESADIDDQRMQLGDTVPLSDTFYGEMESLRIAENADHVAELQEIETDEILSQESTSAGG
jgi:hypothetical protein